MLSIIRTYIYTCKVYWCCHSDHTCRKMPMYVDRRGIDRLCVWEIHTTMARLHWEILVLKRDYFSIGYFLYYQGIFLCIRWLAFNPITSEIIVQSRLTRQVVSFSAVCASCHKEDTSRWGQLIAAILREIFPRIVTLIMSFC